MLLEHHLLNNGFVLLYYGITGGDLYAVYVAKQKTSVARTLLNYKQIFNLHIILKPKANYKKFDFENNSLSCLTYKRKKDNMLK